MATRAPDETDILCESCGYMLNGLPPSGNCPECGSPIDLSISERLRVPPLWEDANDPRPRWQRFLITTARIIFRPTRFYRSINSRGELDPPFRFAKIHWAIAAALFATTAWAHFGWSVVFNNRFSQTQKWYDFLWLPLWILIYWIIRFTITVAAWLTNLEASYRGYRLPIRVVRRAMYYNSAQLIPVGVLLAATVVGYVTLQERGIFSAASAVPYLYVFAGEIVFASGYLFVAYWIAMSNLMYANR